MQRETSPYKAFFLSKPMYKQSLRN